MVYLSQQKNQKKKRFLLKDEKINVCLKKSQYSISIQRNKFSLFLTYITTQKND